MTERMNNKEQQKLTFPELLPGRYSCAVDRITDSKSALVLIPGTCEYVTIGSKGGLRL